MQQADQSGAQDSAKAGVGDQPAGFLAAGLAAVTGVLTAAGVAGDVVGRMVGEKPWLFAAGLSCVLFGGTLAVVASLLRKRPTRTTRRFLLGANFFLFAGLVCMVFAAVGVWSDTRRPSVTATPEQTTAGTFLAVSVKDSGLDSSERVTVLVESLRRGAAPRTRGVVLRHAAPIYSASLGSSDDGKVDHAVRLKLPAGFTGYVGARAYLGSDLPVDCYEAPARGQGCVVAAVTRDIERPQLSAALGPGGRTLVVGVTARDTPASTMALRVLGTTGAAPHRWREVASWRLAAGANGEFRRAVTVPGIARYARICAAASMVEMPRCGMAGRGSSRTAWVRYRVPHR